MATQFDPIAKDESLNTTEATPRNIADVIAEGLKGIEDALPTYTEGDGIDISAQKEISVDTTFTEASTRANIASGDSFSTILGKIKKFFTDLKAVTFSGAAEDVNYGSGSVKDALDDSIHVALVSGSISATFADFAAIGGYRSTQAQRVPMSSLTGYPTGKTIVGYSLYCKNSSAEYYAGVLINHNATLILNCSDPDHSYDIYGTIYYKD